MKVNEAKISLVHEWLLSYAGSEQVSSAILHAFPEAELFSVVDFLTEEQRKNFLGKHATTSFIQKLPKAKKYYQKYLPLMPLAIEQLDVSEADIIISSAHSVAKGVITGPDQLHISYVHSPIRYAWDLQHQYLRESGLNTGVKGWLAKWFLHKIRIWDYRTAHGVDHFIANSQYIARRIKKVYGREASVIYPPVDVENFEVNNEKQDYYFTASRMVPYKRIDLIVETFSQMPDKKLIVIGDGPEMKKIQSKVKDNITLLGYQPFSVLKEHMQNAKAFVFAAEEDFGIIPVEAQACGTPVIAFGKGGALETVRPVGIENPTGIFFKQQTVTSLHDAIDEFEKTQSLFTPNACRENAERFSRARFDQEFRNFVQEKWSLFTTEKIIKRK
ncbi:MULTISPECIES: glycosyltransferase family 4 protein [Enterobacter]|jgi:glycosyltransferase involved in cell wall biosynthesis|uniref:glycosyltransferase family 4 protein n=1 Tax=Enterobacter TaxID=547 RepID=UPI0005EF1200|nr:MULTISPECIES: glycosyltransferase family 4 protein [Enterobacter]ELN9581103.1 glycosyltransferase family 4 protein [Enterobacter roggenkampii]KJM45165.1 glycosyl transferase family 1 [Enterobacter roggenkampii]KTI34363.1 glycosyl transferase family 1 [Enterobacter roggenkampii]MBO4170844.1 glycosyltransferase family 4 protein [Enterobacter roggenkampii]MCK6717412.1 glycosyltransferase family 4 protein [Enterobacter roggenkampii]